MGWVLFPKVRDGLGAPPGGPERVGRPSRRSEPGRGTFLEVWDGSDAPPEGPEGSGDLLKFRDWSVDSPEYPGWVEGPSRRSGTGRRTLLKARDGSCDPSGGPGWVGCSSRRSKMGRVLLPEV